MTDGQRARLTRLLLAFIDAHPGTRRGQLFGRPAAFAGSRPFAEITDTGLACRVPAETVRGRDQTGLLFRPDRRPGWVLVSAELHRLDDVARVTTMLERAATGVAISELERTN